MLDGALQKAFLCKVFVIRGLTDVDQSPVNRMNAREPVIYPDAVRKCIVEFGIVLICKLPNTPHVWLYQLAAKKEQI